MDSMLIYEQVISFLILDFAHRYDPIYHLSLTVCDGITKKVKTLSVKKSAAEFFNIKGELQRSLYDGFLQNLVSDLYSEKKSN